MLAGRELLLKYRETVVLLVLRLFSSLGNSSRNQEEEGAEGGRRNNTSPAGRGSGTLGPSMGQAGRNNADMFVLTLFGSWHRRIRL